MRTGVVTVFLFVTATNVSFARTSSSAADGPWSGQMQCVLSVRAPNYQDDQTHTWRIVPGPPVRNGVFRQWPAMWSVQGSGTRILSTGASETWETTVPDTRAPIAFAVNVNTGRIGVLSQHGGLTFNGAITGSTIAGASQTPISSPLQEWPFPAIDDSPTATSISGTRTRSVSFGVAWRQPRGVPTAETCTWQFVKTAATDAALSSSSAVTGTNTSETTLRSAGSVSGIQTTQTSSTSTAREEFAGTRAAAVASLASTTAIPGMTATLTGPSTLTAGSQGKFDVTFVMVPDGSGVIHGVTLTFDSNEGETAAVSMVPATSNSPVPVSATFTFQSPGTFMVSARGNAARTVTYVENVPRYESQSVYDESCKCNQLKLVQVGSDAVTKTRTEYQSSAVHRPLTVTAPQ